MSTPAIAIRNLSKVFPIPFKRERVVAVRDLSLEVAPGQVYGLLGPNGSGKSTTMKIVLGLISPSAGKTEIFGRDSQDVDSHEEVGFLPENPYFYKYLTGVETLRFYGKLCGLSGSALRDKADELLRLVGLESRPRPAFGRLFQRDATTHRPRPSVSSKSRACSCSMNRRPGSIHRVRLKSAT